MKKKKLPQAVLKIIAASIGTIMGISGLEILARILPASSEFPLQFPLICNDVLKTPPKADLSCIFRRKPYTTGIHTLGKLPPLEIKTLKKTNNIGQFSELDFNSDFGDAGNKLPILTIGDSFVEALQVKNEDTFHGLLNEYSDNDGRFIYSTAIGRGGNSFPQHLVGLYYAKGVTELSNTVIIIPVISNDFGEAFLGDDSNYLGHTSIRTHLIKNQRLGSIITIAVFVL